MNNSKMVLMHKWESLGFKPPFKCVGLFSIPSPSLAEANPSAYQHALSEMPKGYGCGSCSVCGTPLVHNFLIVDGAGAKFSVGCDCVKKIGNTALITSIEKERLKHNREKARAKREEKRKAEYAAREAMLDQERAVNGGLTSYELKEKEDRDRENARRKAIGEENEWLTTPLRKCWMSCTIEALLEGRAHFSDLDHATLHRLAAEYGKLAGRSNSHAYKGKVEEFWKLHEEMTSKYKKD